MAKDKKSPRAKKDKKVPKEKRAASPYNVFMKNEIAKVKKNHPNLQPKEALKMAAANWATSSDNPKNKK